VNGQDENITTNVLKEAGLDIETANTIYRLTSLPKFDERFVIPEAHREEAIEMLENTEAFKGNTGFGKNEKPERGL
jgi:nitrate reductase beta subunit